MGLRSADVGLLLACALAIFLALRMDGHVSYVHIWHYPLAARGARGGGGSGGGARLGPLVRDLDGDGLPEVIVVVATPTPSLRILQIRVHGSQAEDRTSEREEGEKEIHASANGGEAHGLEHQSGEGAGRRFDLVSSVDPDWASVTLSAEVDIVPELRVVKGRVPLAVQSGYTEPYREDASRTQVIVVVTDGCKVLCYCSRLKLLWQASIECELEHHKLADVAILVTSQSIYEGDTGTVIVGVRMDPLQSDGHRDEHSGDLDENLSEDTERDDPKIEAMLRAEHRRDSAMKELKEGHYSYYCFEGRTGEARWSHTGGEFVPEINPAENVAPVTRVSVHEDIKELNWQSFRSSFVESLPHAWFRPEDTSLNLAHFAKRRSGKSRVKKQKRRELDAENLEHQLPGSGFRDVNELLRPHLESEHIKQPNVILAKLRGGLQAIHLFSGKQISQLSLKAASIHADVNADGVIDHVEAIAGWVSPWLDAHGLMEHVQKHIPPSLPRCLVIVSSGIPPQSRLFNNTICPKRFRSRGRRSFDMRFTQEDEQQVTVARPVLVLKYSSKPKNRARSAYSRGGKKYDMIFVASTGHVTSISPEGTRNWQVLTESGWDLKHEIHEKLEKDSTGPNTFLPYAAALQIRENDIDTDTNILAVGDRKATVLDTTGTVRVTMDLAEIPVGPPVLGDFSGDGYTDIILQTEGGLDGYVSRRRISTALVTLLLGGLVITLTLALAFTLTQEL